VLSRWVDAELEDMTQEELDEEVEPLFIAMPFSVKMHDSPPYRGTDPEWQEFIKISKDKALGKQICSMLRPGIGRLCSGKGDKLIFWDR
jgi:hypothetical protein